MVYFLISLNVNQIENYHKTFLSSNQQKKVRLFIDYNSFFRNTIFFELTFSMNLFEKKKKFSSISNKIMFIRKKQLSIQKIKRKHHCSIIVSTNLTESLLSTVALLSRETALRKANRNNTRDNRIYTFVGIVGSLVATSMSENTCVSTAQSSRQSFTSATFRKVLRNYRPL